MARHADDSRDKRDKIKMVSSTESTTTNYTTRKTIIFCLQVAKNHNAANEHIYLYTSSVHNIYARTTIAIKIGTINNISMHG